MDTATVRGDHVVVDDFALDKLMVDASSGPAGENPTGTASFGVVVAPELSFSGPVTCVKVEGDTAIMRVDGPFAGAPGFIAFIFRLTDNGGGGLDTLEYFPILPEFELPLDCETGAPFWLGGRVNGRVEVTDAVPPPTSKTQCRNGGWAAFGFANQGLCISAVARG